MGARPMNQRTLAQSAKLHAMLRDLSRQCKWAGVSWSEEDWKILALGAKYGQTIGPNPFGHGLLIMNKRRSSSLEVPEAMDLISEIQAFGDQEGVQWTDPSVPPVELYEEARR